MHIFIPVLICFGISAVCGILLTLATKILVTKESDSYLKVRDCLPGANCGACGYNGCDRYAKALAEGKTEKVNLCVPGGDGTARELADILGVEFQDVVEQVAYVSCNGTCDIINDKKYNYLGTQSCRAAKMAYAGDRFCSYACLGYGDCAKVCPQNAIEIDSGVARIIPSKCIGCGLCTRTCPNHIIHLVKDTARVVVTCSNNLKGSEVRKYCTNGCIGCGKCVKTCPEGAIRLENNLAKIDYDKCTGCQACSKACPVKCILEGKFLCGASR